MKRISALAPSLLVLLFAGSTLNAQKTSSRRLGQRDQRFKRKHRENRKLTNRATTRFPNWQLEFTTFA